LRVAHHDSLMTDIQPGEPWLRHLCQHSPKRVTEDKGPLPNDLPAPISVSAMLRGERPSWLARGAEQNLEEEGEVSP
jgi:hypothetical protein